MKRPKSLYHRRRFPPDVIQYAVWFYHRFSLGFRDIEDLLAERGVTVFYETVRRWCKKFGPTYARRLRRRYGRHGDTWHMDEVFVRIRGKQRYLYRAVDQDGDVIDILIQRRRDTKAAVRFFRKLLRGQGGGPRRLVTDKLKSYPGAYRRIIPDVVQVADRTQTIERRFHIDAPLQSYFSAGIPANMCRSVYRDQYLKELMRELRAALVRNARRGTGLVAACFARIVGAAREPVQKKPPAKTALVS